MVNIIIIQNGIPCAKNETYLKKIFELCDTQTTIINLDKIKLERIEENELRNTLQFTVGVIITGIVTDNKIDFFKDSFYASQIDIINLCHKESIPVLGIGIGCQLIGLLYGLGQARLQEPRESFGFFDKKNVDTELWYADDFLKTISLKNLENYSYSSCTYILANSNSNIDKYAFDSAGNPLVIKHKGKPIYGFQDYVDIDPIIGIFFLSLSKTKNKKVIERFSTENKQMQSFTESLMESFGRLIYETKIQKQVVDKL